LALALPTYAVLALGHFGATLRRSRAGASEWDECAAPTYRDGDLISAGLPTGDGPIKTKPASPMGHDTIVRCYRRFAFSKCPPTVVLENLVALGTSRRAKKFRLPKIFKL
jgi:hypothetical protein